MPGLPDCRVCDFANRPEECHALRVKVPRLCQLIEMGRCDYRRQVWGLSTIVPAPFACPEPEPVVLPTVSEPPAVPHTVTDTVPPAITFAVAKCEHRTQQPNCGCAGKWRCERDQADVTWPQCIACKTAEADAHAADDHRGDGGTAG